MDFAVTGPKASVLIVEDDQQVASAVRRHLVRAGLRVLEPVDDGVEAVRCVASEHPDLVIVDIGLQGDVDGFEAALRIRGTPPFPAVIFLTGASDDASLARAIDAGAVGYVVKPFTATHLLTTVRVGLALGQADRLRRQPGSPAALPSSQPATARRPRQALWEPLTAREREVVQLVVTHRRPRAVAQALGISYHTVRNHLKQIYRKTGVSSLLDLVTAAVLSAPPAGRSPQT